MEDIEQNDDEMILVVVGDDDGIKTYETSDSLEPEKPLLINVKDEPREHLKKLNCTEDIKDIFTTAVKDEAFIEVIIKRDVKEEDEEYLSEEHIIEEEFIQEDVDTKDIETNVSQKKRTRRKTHHKYLLDQEDSHLSQNNKKRNNNVTSPKNKKRKTKLKYPPKLKPKPKNAEKTVQNVQTNEKPASITDEHGFIEIEFLEDDVLVAPKEEFTETEFLEDPPKKNKRKKNVPSKKNTVKKDEDDEYIPEEEDQEEEFEEDFIEEEYILPTKERQRKPKISKRQTQTAGHTKAVERPKRSFIAELKKKQPLFKEDKEKLVEYLVEYMRKRRPPSPPPNYYYHIDENRYGCSYCDMEKPTEAAAGRHYQAAHGPRYLVCLACGSGFRSTVILYKHEKRCSAPDANIQLRARGVFLGRKGRGRPYLTKNKFIPKEPPPDRPPRPVHIPHCQKTKYYCSQCPAYFTREYLLDEHMHKHTGFRAFQCPDCPVAYVSRYQLNKHSKKHSNMQYICDHCGKVFKLKTTLTSHMDTHLPRPRFGCGRCGRRYAKRAAVRVHIMRDHMQMPPPAACPVCPKRYNRMSHVKLHMKRDHGLTMLTKRSIERELPYMKVEDLKGAKVVFNKEDGIEVMDINPTLNEQILP